MAVANLAIRTVTDLTVYAACFRHGRNYVGTGRQQNTKLNMRGRNFITDIDILRTLKVPLHASRQQ
jgi:hypothetical protein